MTKIEGFEEYLKQGFIGCLQFGDVDRAIKIKNELAQGIDLTKIEGFENTLRISFIKYLKYGNIDKATKIKNSELAQGIDLATIEGFEDSLKEGFTDCLKKGDIDEAIKIKKSELAKGVDITDSLKQGFIFCLQTGYVDRAIKIKNSELAQGIDLTKIEGLEESLKQGFISCLQNGDVDGAIKIKNSELTKEIDLIDSLKKVFIYYLSYGDVDNVIAIKKSELAKGVDIAGSLKQGFIFCLQTGYIDRAIKIKNSELAQGIDLTDSIKQRFIKLLQDNKINDAIKIKNSELAQGIDLTKTEGFEDFLKQGFTDCLKNGDIDNATEIKNELAQGIDLATIEGFEDSLKQGFTDCLKNGDIDKAIKIKNSELAQGIDLATIEGFEDSLKQGFTDCLKNGDIDKAIKIKNSELAKGVDITDSLKQGFIFCLQTGYVNRAIKIKNSELAQGIDLKEFDEEINNQCILSLTKYAGLISEVYKNSQITEKNLTSDNWIETLSIYGTCHLEDESNEIPDEIKEKMAELFPENDATNRNFIFDRLYEVYQKLLDEGEKSLSFKEQAILKVISVNGAGNMSLVESLGEFMHQLNESFKAKTTVDRTKKEIKQGLQKMESIIAKQNWDIEDRRHFYKISEDVVGASPALFASYVHETFPNLSKKELSEFIERLWPLYHTEIVLGENIDNKEADLRFLAQNRKDLWSFNKELKENEDEENINKLFIKEESRLLENIKGIFKEKMGIVKIPEKLNENHVESIKKYGTYLVNMADKNEKKEEILGLFLALKLNGKWEEFRENLDSVNVNEYMAPEVAGKLKEYLKLRSKNDIFKDISPETMQKIEEEQVSAIMGNVQTIDLRLQSINSNIKELADEDIFEGKEKDILRIVNKYGKQAGASLAAKFRELEKGQPVSPEHQEILGELQKAFEIESWTKENIKEVQKLLSDTMPNKIINLVNKLGDIYEKEKVEEKIGSLNKEKIPTEEVVKIFQKLGEDFTSESGIVPIGNDVHYLMTLVEKEENKKLKKKLSPEEIKIAKEYLAGVGDKIRNLESVWTKLYEMVKSFEKNTENSNNEQLKDRFDSIKGELEKSIGTEARNIVGIMTCDLEEVINNIRACLKCTTNGCNNDTNLSFGDRNRFFLYCKNENSKKSFADQLVTVLPVKKENNEQKLHFVMDNVYGERVPDVLVLNTLNVLKKLKAVNDKKFEIFVTDAAVSSTNVSDISYLENRLKENTDIQFQIEKANNITVTVPEKSAEDAYQEFGGGVRSSGDRQVSGYVIKLK